MYLFRVVVARACCSAGGKYLPLAHPREKKDVHLNWDQLIIFKFYLPNIKRFVLLCNSYGPLTIFAFFIDNSLKIEMKYFICFTVVDDLLNKLEKRFSEETCNKMFITV